MKCDYHAHAATYFMNSAKLQMDFMFVLGRTVHFTIHKLHAELTLETLC